MAYNTMRNSSGFQGDIESGFSPELNGDIPGNIVLGIQGPPGGYYTPSVSQPDASTMRIRHTASKSDMPGVNATDITLPPGPKGDPFTFEDFTPEQLEFLRGPKGNAFTYEDFTPEQLESLRGKQGEPGKDGTVSFDELTEEQRESLKGDPFTYDDFTAEQLEALKGEPGYTPQKGIDYVDGKNGADGGHYTPTVTQPDDTTMQIVFTPSKTGMPTVQPVTVTLPVNPDSGGNVDLTGYAKEQWVQENYQPKGEYLTEVPDGYAKTSDIPTKPEDIGAMPDTYTPPNQTAEQVGADPKGTAASAVSQHNTANDSHGDIRLELKAINDRLTAFFDSDDTTLDELSEIVAYITSNKTLIESITTSKVSVTDIINNLTTNVTNKPLSAAQGVVLKGLIDAVSNSLSGYQTKGDYALRSEIPSVPTKVSQFQNDAGYLTQHQDISGKMDANKLPEAINTALAQAKASGEFDGADGDDYVLTEADKDEIAAKVSIVKVAEPPEFVNDISDCSDTSKMYVLPNGHLAAYMTEEVTTEGSTVPNFTNIYNTANGAYIKDGYRYSSSSASFKECTTDCSIVVPINVTAASTNVTLRVRGATLTGCAYPTSIYIGADNQNFGTTGRGGTTNSTDENGDVVITVFVNDPAYAKYANFHVAAGVDESSLIVTQDEEITYTVTEGGTEIVTEWTDTGIEYNQPPDYTDRVVAVEKKTAQLVNDVGILENRVNNIGSGSGGLDAFAFAAYPPSPQLPGDGSDEADFNVDDVATSEVYAYMDALWNRYRTYMVKQNLGKDSSGKYDYYRYVFSKAYWRAWYKENYPKMFAWVNGSTVIYSESVSPRVGDTMYTTPYIGTVYSTVTAVNSETIGVASTRTVNGLEFTRYADGDAEPTIVYTVPLAITANYKGRTYTDTFGASHGISEFTHEYIVDSTGTKFYRYPFEDRKLDKSRLFSVFILTNEHGNNGDSMIPSVVVMRMLKDLCNNADNLFLRWMKENAIVTVIPLGNPYGGYNNANNVNINRNYDTPGWAGSNTDPAGGTKEEGAFGAYAGDQIETQYIMNTIQQCKARVALSGHGRGVPTNVLGEYNSSAMFQGCGFDAERMWKVEEALFSMYNFGFEPNGQHTIPDQTSDNYLNAGKSPSYIEYTGAVGGLIEIDDFEVGTLDRFTPLAMEQAYAEVLLVLQNWVEEALNK